MDTNKEAARAVLRRCMQAEFAYIPGERELPDEFSPAFCGRMDDLIAGQKRRHWSALPHRSRRALIAAAILAACFVLVAWTPVGGMVVDLLTTAYENIVDYHPDPGLRTEIETVYAPAWLPEGFEEVSREMTEDYYLEVAYKNAEGDELLFRQIAASSFSGAVDNENIRVEMVKMGDREVLLGVAEKGTIATWTQDLYLMDLVYRGKVEMETLEQIILSVAPEA